MGWGREVGDRRQSLVFLLSPRWHLLNCAPSCSAHVPRKSPLGPPGPSLRSESLAAIPPGCWKILGLALNSVGTWGSCQAVSGPLHLDTPSLLSQNAGWMPQTLCLSLEAAVGGWTWAADHSFPNILLSVLCSRNSVRRVRAKGTEHRPLLSDPGKGLTLVLLSSVPARFSPPSFISGVEKKSMTISRSIFLLNVLFLPRFQVLKFKRQEFASFVL